MKLDKILLCTGALIAGIAITESIRNSSGLVGTAVKEGLSFTYTGKGVSGKSERVAPGYSISVYQDSLLGKPIKRNLSVSMQDTNNGAIYGASAIYRYGKWTVMSNNLPIKDKIIFENPSKLFETFWKETY